MRIVLARMIRLPPTMFSLMLSGLIRSVTWDGSKSPFFPGLLYGPDYKDRNRSTFLTSKPIRESSRSRPLLGL